MTQPLSADQLLAERAVVSLREYGRLLGMSAGAVRARADRGRLGVPTVQLVQHGARFVRTSDIRAMLSRATEMTTTELTSGGDCRLMQHPGGSPPAAGGEPPGCGADAKE